MNCICKMFFNDALKVTKNKQQQQQQLTLAERSET